MQLLLLSKLKLHRTGKKLVLQWRVMTVTCNLDFSDYYRNFKRNHYEFFIMERPRNKFALDFDWKLALILAVFTKPKF